MDPYGVRREIQCYDAALTTGITEPQRGTNNEDQRLQLDVRTIDVLLRIEAGRARISSSGIESKMQYRDSSTGYAP